MERVVDRRRAEAFRERLLQIHLRNVQITTQIRGKEIAARATRVGFQVEPLSNMTIHCGMANSSWEKAFDVRVAVYAIHEMKTLV
jgi:hypothetical protein